MKKDQGDVWPSQFTFDDWDEEKSISISEEVLEDSYKALNKIYQKEHKKSKAPKKARQAWQ